jgi:integrase
MRVFADEARAMAEAKRLARLLAAGETHAASIRNPDAAAYGKATAMLAEIGDDLLTATHRYVAAVKVLGRGDLVEPAALFYSEAHRGIAEKPIAEAVEVFLEAKRSQGASTRYVQDLGSRLGAFARSFNVNCGAVVPALVQEWLDGLKLSPQSTKNFRTALGTFFTFAKARGWCASNPAEGVVVAKVRSSKETETFTAEEFALMLTHADPRLRPYLVIGGLCGLRSAEALRLKWEDVRLESREIVLSRGMAKTKARRIVPIGDAAFAWLSLDVRQTGPVSPNPTALRRLREKLVEASGVIWKDNGLRHSYASARVAVTQDVARVALELGNSPGVVHQHYRALWSEEMGKAWFAIMPTQPANVTRLPMEAAA